MFLAITPNINGLKGKYNELLLLIQRRKPDTICLQETKKLANDKSIHVNGYIVHEVPVDGTGLGLAIGMRKDLGLAFNVVELNYDLILISALVNSTKVLIGNIYRSQTRSRKGTYLWE